MSFAIAVSDGVHRLLTRCQLSVTMLSEAMLAQSVTLTLANMRATWFLELLYERLSSELLSQLVPTSEAARVHMLSVASDGDLNITLAVSYDYSRDLFVPARLLRQLVYAHSAALERQLGVSRVRVVDEAHACALESCPNLMRCVSRRHFVAADDQFTSAWTTDSYIIGNSYDAIEAAGNVQLRGVQTRVTLSCECARVFAGVSRAAACDVEVGYLLSI